MTSRLLTPPSTPLDVSVRVPGSKSLTNRAAIVAALTEGTSLLEGVLESDDTRVMRQALRTLGLTIEHDEAAATMRIEGQGGRFPTAGREPISLDLHNSGTSIRFLTAAVAAAAWEGEPVTLSGIARMQERPIASLLTALQALGGDARDVAGTGCPPVVVGGQPLQGGEVAMRGDVSSQFLSAVLMAAPLARQPTTVRIEGDLVSRPYVDMTLAVMTAFGAAVEEPTPNTFTIAATPYVARRTAYAIEPDASAASYWMAAGALAGRVRIERLDRSALQGDVHFAGVLEQMGAVVEEAPGSLTVSRPADGRLRGIDVDMGDISDTAQTAAVVALFAEGPTRIRGVEHMRHKETDRVAALVAEIRRLGLEADEHPDGLTIHPGVPVPREPVHTYDDHRMAMSFALAGLMTHDLEIADPGCVAKTYPGFWDDWNRLVES